MSVTPIVDIRPSLLQNPAAELFRVRATRPSYWRMVVLDHFDGSVWSATGLQTIDGPVIDGPAALGGAPDESGARLDQEFEIREFATNWLPAAPEPLAASIDGELGARLDTDTGVLALDAAAEEGVRYRITSTTPVPRPAELDEVDPGDALPGYQALPHQLPFRLREIALEVTARATSPFRQVMALQEHLRTFRYDEHAPAGHGNNAMVNFLEETQQGYCEQFAGTMAVLARTLGLPSRVAIGFLPGERDESGAFRVDTGDVHAWPEVYFGRFGWLAVRAHPWKDQSRRRIPVQPPRAAPPRREPRQARPAAAERRPEPVPAGAGHRAGPRSPAGAARPRPSPSRRGGR